MPAKRSSTRPVRAAIYCRLSRDVEGDLLGVKRQEKDARALCERKGWHVAELFVDDDVSAWSGKRRPAYRQLLAAIEAGEVDAVVAYDLDRLHRLPRELEEFFETCDRAGVTNLATVAGDVDLATPEGRLVARIMGAVAKKSSDDTSRRPRRKWEEVAEAGLPHPGARPFGYERDGITIKKGEAKVIRELARRLLAGDSLTSLAADLNARAIPNPQRGRAWAGTTVRTPSERRGRPVRREGRAISSASTLAITTRQPALCALGSAADAGVGGGCRRPRGSHRRAGSSNPSPRIRDGIAPSAHHDHGRGDHDDGARWTL